jgi:hypothetical protein
MNLSKVDDELAQVDGFERRRCEREEEEIEEYKSPTCFLISRFLDEEAIFSFSSFIIFLLNY